LASTGLSYHAYMYGEAIASDRQVLRIASFGKYQLIIYVDDGVKYSTENVNKGNVYNFYINYFTAKDHRTLVEIVMVGKKKKTSSLVEVKVKIFE